jgi:hypothetical protein
MSPDQLDDLDDLVYDALVRAHNKLAHLRQPGMTAKLPLGGLAR